MSQVPSSGCPDVSVNIPTLNSSATIASCIQSVLRSSVPVREILVLDGGSSDGTVQIAQGLGAEVIECGTGLLRARLLGVKNSSSEFVLMLDADQVLQPGTIARAGQMIDRGLDMIVLGEVPESLDGIMERMWWAERRGYAKRTETHPFDFSEGALLPRFFKRTVLNEVAADIPPEIQSITHPDHQIIAYLAARHGARTGFLPDAVVYHERTSILDILRRYSAHGRDAARLARWPQFVGLVQAKSRRRIATLLTLRNDAPASLILYFIRGVPFLTGYLSECVFPS